MEIRGEQLRQLMGSDEAVPVLGVYDRVSARLAALLGYQAVFVSGFVTGVRLGVEEALLTLTELSEATAEAARHSGVPVITDAIAGFAGPPEDIERCVIELETAGAAAIHIEDEPYPVPQTAHQGVEGLLSLDEFRLKFMAASEARRDSSFLLIARTNAAMGPTGSQQEAFRRLTTVIEAGAEACLIVGAYEARALEAFRRELPGVPLMTFGVPGLRVKDYRELGYQMVVYPGLLLQASVAAMKASAGELLEKGEAPVGADPRTVGRSLRELVLIRRKPAK